MGAVAAELGSGAQKCEETRCSDMLVRFEASFLRMF